MPSLEYEENVAYEMKRRSRCCIHFRALELFRDKQACAREVPVRKKAYEGNGRSNYGIALRLPCEGVSDPFFQCPWFEAVGIERARDEMIEMREAGARILKRLAKQMAETPHDTQEATDG